MTKITERKDWFELWLEDRTSMTDTMVRNMASDLENGYNYFGECITRQKAQIEAYKAATDAALDMFKEMDDAKVSRWCYYDLIKRGVI